MKPSSFRWLMIAFAFLATVINYLDRQVLSVVVTAPDFKAMVPLTQEAYGYITAAFMLAYAVSNGLSGWLIGRHGYTPVFIGYGILPVIALAIVIFLLGPLRPHPDFRARNG